MGGTTWTPPSRREWTIDSNRSACIGLARRDSRSFATKREPFPRERTEATNSDPVVAPKAKSPLSGWSRAIARRRSVEFTRAQATPDFGGVAKCRSDAISHGHWIEYQYSSS